VASATDCINAGDVLWRVALPMHRLGMACQQGLTTPSQRIPNLDQACFRIDPGVDAIVHTVVHDIVMKETSKAALSSISCRGL